jgi:hypothetical protein
VGSGDRLVQEDWRVVAVLHPKPSRDSAIDIIAKGRCAVRGLTRRGCGSVEGVRGDDCAEAFCHWPRRIFRLGQGPAGERWRSPRPEARKEGAAKREKGDAENSCKSTNNEPAFIPVADRAAMPDAADGEGGHGGR